MDVGIEQAKILAQVVYEIRLLLVEYLGSQNPADPVVRIAAHLAYAAHNEALAVMEGMTFDGKAVIEKIEFVDRMFGEDYMPLFKRHMQEEK